MRIGSVFSAIRSESPARKRRFSGEPPLRKIVDRFTETALPPARLKVAVAVSGAVVKPPAAAIASEMRQLGPISKSPGVLTAPETDTC